jgi:putative ABC transport system permease protein
MTLLVGSLTMGLILSLLALGVLFSFRIVAFRDLTVDGSITLGGTVAATLLVAGHNPWVATLGGCLAGALAGSVTGLLATRFKINGLLAGILVMTALYSVNLRVMGRSNLPLLKEQTVFTAVQPEEEPRAQWTIGRWKLSPQDARSALLAAAVIAVMGAGAFAFLRSNLGLAMCATGDNPDMIRALGVNVGRMTTLGLAISNGLVAFSGALLAQYQGFADVQMGIGMVVWGFASVIIGETLVGSRQVGWLIVGAVMGSILFRLLVAIALRWGLNPNDLKLITALFVFAALILPGSIATLKSRLLPPPPAPTDSIAAPLPERVLDARN